ncbi:MAG: type II secretion system minor pseudopilin GspK [Syntrophobacterales bacterium]|jgi:general secretion pathway protein K
MKIKKVKLSQSGAALILALLMISILVVLVLETMRAMQVEGAGARHFQYSIQAEAMAKSGVYLAMSVLSDDLEENDVDHQGEAWGSLPEPDALPVALPEAGTLEGEVLDETGKFPINYLVDDDGNVRQAYQQVLERLLTNPPFLMDEEDAQALVTAIRDWLDKDDEPAGEFGAETDYYQTLETPYEIKNNVLTSLAELRLIRGITDLLYFGKEGEPGLKDLLTLYSDGKININTAGPLVLQALVSPAVSQDTAASWAESVVEYRQEPMHWDFMGEPDWYRNRMAGYNDVSVQTELITTQSAFFSAKMTGVSGVARRSIFAAFERRKAQKEQSQVNILVRFWQVY